MTEQAAADFVRELAFREEPARDANQAIGVVREEYQRDHSRVFSYELVGHPDQTVLEFLQAVVPKLVYFAQTTDRALPACAGMFLSVFFGERLYFVHAAVFLEKAAQAYRVSLAELAERYGPAEAMKLPAGPLHGLLPN